MIKRKIKKSVKAIASCDSFFYLIAFKSGLRNNTIKNEVNLTERTVLSC